MIVY
jgi:hypothetical protein